MPSVTSVTVRVPLTIRRRGGRKMIISPDGVAMTAGRGTPADICVTRGDPALVKALARGFRWKRMLQDGRYSSVSEMAASEKLDRGYLGGCSNSPCWRPTSFRRSWTGGNRPG